MLTFNPCEANLKAKAERICELEQDLKAKAAVEEAASSHK